MSSLRLTGSKSQTSNLSSSSNGPIKKQNDGSNESTGQNGDARPPPSPEELETLSDVGGNPVSIFVDETKPQSERLIAIESLEPELLDETEIGRLLLGLQKCIQSEIDPALQQTAFETIGRVDNQIKKSRLLNSILCGLRDYHPEKANILKLSPNNFKISQHRC